MVLKQSIMTKINELPYWILRTVRRINSAVTTTSLQSLAENAAAETEPKDPGNNNDGGLNLDDSERLFATFSTMKLLRSATVLQVAAMEPLVDLGLKVMNSQMMENPIFRRVALAVTERTFYPQFCAGTNLERVGVTVQKLKESAGITAMLDYAMEHADDNQSCDQNLNQFIRTIDWTKTVENRPVSFVVVKITAICPSILLRRISDLLRWQQKDSSFNLPWKMRTLPIFSENSPLYHTLTRPDPLTREEETDLELALARFENICQHGLKSGVPLLIDAEDTLVQPAIDYFSYSAAIMHSDRVDARNPLVYNTIQAYLGDAEERLVMAKRAADTIGLPVGFKLVRGAYMSSEMELANSLGVNSPIHKNIEATHNCYNECAEFLMEGIARGSGSAVLATHNAESCKLATKKAVDLGIRKENDSLQFAQLYGMADGLSYGLKDAGFRVSKYLPFGPVDQVIPYLLRRAEENKGLLSTSSKDRALMWKEVQRRASRHMRITFRTTSPV